MAALYWTIKQDYGPWRGEIKIKNTPQVLGNFALKKPIFNTT